MLENWSEINNYPIYYISNKGRVYDLVKRELVQPTILDGVLTIVLQEEYDPPVTLEVQKLVSEHFPKSDEDEDESNDNEPREPYVKITSTSQPNVLIVLSLDELRHWSKTHNVPIGNINKVLRCERKSTAGYRFEYV